MRRVVLWCLMAGAVCVAGATAVLWDDLYALVYPESRFWGTWKGDWRSSPPIGDGCSLSEWAFAVRMDFDRRAGFGYVTNALEDRDGDTVWFDRGGFAVEPESLTLSFSDGTSSVYSVRFDEDHEGLRLVRGRETLVLRRSRDDASSR